MAQIVKATTKGQITLPAKWRKQFNTNQYLLVEKKGRLEIKPVDMEKIEEEEYFTVFDAERDNNGEGIPIDEFLKMLKNMD